MREISTPRGIETSVLHGSIMSILQSVGERFPAVPGAYQALFANYPCVYITDVL
jgi:hypothetical protein